MKITKQRLKEIIREELAEARPRSITRAQVDVDEQIGELLKKVKQIVNNSNVTEEIISSLEEWVTNATTTIDRTSRHAQDLDYEQKRRYLGPGDPPELE